MQREVKGEGHACGSCHRHHKGELLRNIEEAAQQGIESTVLSWPDGDAQTNAAGEWSSESQRQALLKIAAEKGHRQLAEA